MQMTQGDITLRTAVLSDAPILNQWWNDGELMKHVGFPEGIGQSLSETEDNIRSWENKRSQLFIIEQAGEAIGECNIQYRPNDTTAYPGWKISQVTKQNQGLGTRVVLMLCEHIFRDPAITAIYWDTLGSNERARHIYRTKFGLEELTAEPWTDSSGETREVVAYQLDRNDLARIKQNLAQTKSPE